MAETVEERKNLGIREERSSISPSGFPFSLGAGVWNAAPENEANEVKEEFANGAGDSGRSRDIPQEETPSHSDYNPRWAMLAFVVFAFAQAAPILVLIVFQVAGLHFETEKEEEEVLLAFSGPIIGVLYASGSIWIARKLKWSHAFLGWRWQGWRVESRHIGLGVGIVLVSIAFSLLYAWGLEAFGVELETLPEFGYILDSWFLILLFGGTVVIAAPFGEELFFRGVVLGGATALRPDTQWPRWWPVSWRTELGRQLAMTALVSVLFSLLHMSLASFVQLCVFAMMLGMSRLRTGSLIPAISAHMINNFFAFIEILVDS